MVLWLVALTMAGASPLFAQQPGANVNVRVANLEQDVRRLQQDLSRLRLDMEEVLRANTELRTALQRQQQLGNQQYVTLSELNTRLEALQSRLNQTLAANRTEIVNLVASEVERMAGQTQKALDAMGRSISSQPRAPAAPVTFSDDFPKTGTSYTVQAGDSLGAIARRLNSRVEWIRNANRLATDVIYPGQELFIPQN